MARTRPHASDDAPRSDLDAALATMSADALRDVVRELLGRLDDREQAGAIGRIVARVARSGAGWAPAPVSREAAAEAISFAHAATKAARADPVVMDHHLQVGAAAFLRRDYATAREVLEALLLPLAGGRIDLGQDELFDEVLGSDLATCVAQYAVSVYMTTQANERAQAMWTTIEEVRGIGHFWEPLRELERVAVEPLPGLAEFLPGWRSIVEASVRRPQAQRGWSDHEERWLREVVHRLEGSNGLARRARETRASTDLDAWCESLTDAGDWAAALPAFEEAAILIGTDGFARGRYLDGAALAAQQLGRPDLTERLEAAWQSAPSLLRLRRWLGASTDHHALQSRVSQALKACPSAAARQLALLHVLAGDVLAAAELLVQAPGAGWSGDEHPGPLLFAFFIERLGGARKLTWTGIDAAVTDGFEALLDDHDGPRLASPRISEIIARVGGVTMGSPDERRIVLEAMKQAAEKRIASVTADKHRSRYAQAAGLVAGCVACDESGESARWAMGIKLEYRRFPSFRQALENALGAS